MKVFAMLKWWSLALNLSHIFMATDFLIFMATDLFIFKRFACRRIPLLF